MIRMYIRYTRGELRNLKKVGVIVERRRFIVEVEVGEHADNTTPYRNGVMMV